MGDFFAAIVSSVPGVGIEGVLGAAACAVSGLTGALSSEAGEPDFPASANADWGARRKDPVSRLSIQRTTVSDPPGFWESSHVGS